MENMSGLLLPIALLAFFYFLMIRPQQQQQKRRRAMLEALKKGDKVITIGGIYGVITELDPENVRVEIAPNLTITMTRASIGHVQSE